MQVSLLVCNTQHPKGSRMGWREAGAARARGNLSLYPLRYPPRCLSSSAQAAPEDDVIPAPNQPPGLLNLRSDVRITRYFAFRPAGLDHPMKIRK